MEIEPHPQTGAKHADLMLFTGTWHVALHRSRGMNNAAYLQIGSVRGQL